MKQIMMPILVLLMMLTSQSMLAENSKSQIPLADPYILVEDGVYYAYGTHSADGIEVYRSEDLQNWQYVRLALNKENTTEKMKFWAPEVYHKNDKYYMYYSANEHLFVATSDSPTGPFRQIGGYLVENLIGDEKCIDSSVFFDDDGKAWLFFVRFTDGNCIWSCELQDDYITPVEGTLRLCFAVSQDWEKKLGRVNEGPFVLKHNGRYYLTYSGNDYQSQDYGVGYATSNSLKGPWNKYYGNPIVHNVENLVGCGHHSVFTDLEGKMRIVFHAHNSMTTIHPRLMYIGYLDYKGLTLYMTDNPVVRPVIGTSDIGQLQSEIHQALPISVFGAGGQRIGSVICGLNIIRMSDGSGRKVISD